MWATISQISNSYIGLTYKPSDLSEEGIIVLRSSNIQNGLINYHDIVRVKCDIPEKLLISRNDILICARNGSKKLVGKSAIFDGDTKMTFGAFMAVCKTKLYSFVHLYMQSSLFFNQLSQTSGTTTINQLTQKALNNFLIPIPPFSEQLKIVDKYTSIIKLLN